MKLLSKFKLSIHFTVFLTTICSLNSAPSGIYLVNTYDYFEQGVQGGHYRVDTETGKITRYKALTTTEIVIAFVAVIVLSCVFFVVSVSKYQ